MPEVCLWHLADIGNEEGFASLHSVSDETLRLLENLLVEISLRLGQVTAMGAASQGAAPISVGDQTMDRTDVELSFLNQS
jgi:hypothetical protein